MAKNAEKKLLLFKKETTEGTDSTPVEATNAILTRNFQSTPIEAEQFTRELDGYFFGARPSQAFQFFRRCTFEVEIMGAGSTAVTKPAWGPLMEPCGMDGGVVVSTTHVLQSLISSAIPSASLYFFYDNLKHRMLGSRGNVTLDFTQGQVPFFGFDFVGGIPTGTEWATEATPSAATLSAFKDPKRVETGNTTFTLDSFSPPLRSLRLDFGNSIEKRSLVGPSDKTLFRNREITGEAVIEIPDLTSKNYFAKVLDRTTSVMQLVHGTGTGNIFQLDAPKVEIANASYTEEQGVLMATLSLRFLYNAGNDELSWQTK